jgi:glycosyltransferase involved in cell wall biosynthesis
MNILHWPSSYPDPNRNQPFHCIFVEEHIRSLLPYSNNRVLYISSESTLRSKWHERIDTEEHGINVTRYYFNKRLNLQFLNFYIRLVLLSYFINLVIFKKFKPQIIHIHFFTSGIWANLYCKLLNIKMVVTEHWTALIGYPLISKRRLLGAKKVYEYANWILPVSTHLRDGIIERTQAAIENKNSIIHNAVNTDIFYYKPIQVNNNQLITVIRLDEQKDIPTMLKAVAIAQKTCTHLTLKIIGGGDPNPFIDIANQLKINSSVEFLGTLPKQKIAELMNQSNIFILSSIAENSPCVIGEAHCCGLPVVATNVGGVKELIMEGAVVPPKSAELLAEKILEQLEKKVDKVALSKRAQAHFSYNAIGQQIFEVYQNVCAE